MGAQLGLLASPFVTAARWMGSSAALPNAQSETETSEEAGNCLQEHEATVASSSSSRQTLLRVRGSIEVPMMGSFNILLDLHYPLDECIVNDWLELQDLPNLDAAFCNHSLRQPFLTLLKSRQLRAFEADQLRIPERFQLYLDWVASRRIQTKLLAAGRSNWKLMTNPKYRCILENLEVVGLGCGTTDQQTSFPTRSLDLCPNIFALILISIRSFSRLKPGQRLQRLSKLKTVSILQSSITVLDLLILLEKSPVLQCLMFNGCELSLEPSQYLADANTHVFNRLRWLQLLKNDFMSDAAFLTVLRGCSTLEYLKIAREDGCLLNYENDDDDDDDDTEGDTSIYSNAAVEALPSYLTSTKLKILDLEGLRRLQDKELLSLIKNSCATLVDINLSVCRCISDRSIIYLAQHCPLLKVLMLSLTNITDQSLHELALHCPLLETIQLYGCRRITNHGLLSLQRLSRTLVFVSVSECLQINDQGLLYLLAGASKLNKLCLTHSEPTAKITDATIDYIGLHSAVVRSLLLTNLTGISSVALQKMVLRCGCLTWLDVSGCSGAVDDAFVKTLAENCPLLETIEMNRCPLLTDRALVSLGNGQCAVLSEIAVQFGGPQLTLSGVLAVLTGCRRINKINLTGCPSCSEAACRQVLLRPAHATLQVWIVGQVLHRRLKPDQSSQFISPFI